MHLVTLVPVLAIFGALYVGAWLSPRARIQRALRAARHTPIGEIADGAVAKVAGAVRCIGEPLVAPYSKRVCAHYKLVVERLAGIGAKSRWIEVVNEERSVDFLLDDETGTALVRSGDATVDMAFDVNPEPWLINKVPASVAERLTTAKVPQHGLVFETALRCREAVFAVGERVAVSAVWRREPALEPRGDDGGYRASPTWLVAQPQPAGARAIVLSDDPATLN